MKLTAQQVYDKLVYEDRIFELQGQIRFYLGDVDIIVKQKDVVGNIVQEWLQGWLEKRGIEFDLNDNTQMPPDFFLDKDDHTKGLMEVKAFNREKGPGFDIADFRAYEEEIVDAPYMLNVDYLIFGYEMTEDGIVIIRDLRLKKVWEICCSSADWALKLQVKAGVVHKIRPGTWYSQRPQFGCFASKEHFLSAVEEVMYQNPKTHEVAGSWKRNCVRSYRDFYGEELRIPRWDDIADLYQ